MKGSYLLLIELKKEILISIGKLGKKNFSKGYYVYIGSALNNIENRILHHLGKDKKNHWHIDYFLSYGRIIKIFYKENNIKEECMIVKNLNKSLCPVLGFGCSDCKCNSHLFYGYYEEIIDVIKKLKMRAYDL
jgi:Uri superfamily endonuclease